MVIYSQNKEKKRESKFEVMRIFSMIFVVMWHLILHSNLYDASGTLKFFLEFLILIGVVHINSFVLVSGYFQCESKFSLKKFLNLVITVWFYKAVFVIIFKFFHLTDIGGIELIKELLPIDFRDYWYVNCYLVLYILSPWLNYFIKNINQKEFRKLLIILFVLFSIIPFISNQATISNDGYTIVQFVFMYFIGAYLRQYPIDNNYHFKNYSHHKKQLLFLGISIFCLIFNFILLQFSHMIFGFGNSFLSEIGRYIFSNNRLYSNPIVVIQSIFYFLFFSTLSIKNNKINFVSRVVLDVYLIHENYYMIFWMYDFLGVNSWISSKGSYQIVLFVFLYTILIFVSCILIGLIRKIIFDFFSRRKFIRRIKNMFCKYICDF